ncbi:unnamed protein product [Sphagnum balticum]
MTESNIVAANIHQSRVGRIVGEEAPTLIRQRLQGWGMSTIECVIRQMQLGFKGENAIFELIDEAKVDVWSIDGFNAQTLSKMAMGATSLRLRIATMMKNFLNAIVLDAKDKYEQKQVTFTGMAEMMDKIMILIAAACRMPETVLTARHTRNMDLYDRGLYTPQEAMEAEKKDGIVSIESVVAQGAEPEPPMTQMMKRLIACCPEDQFIQHLNDCEIWSCKIIEKKNAARRKVMETKGTRLPDNQFPTKGGEYAKILRQNGETDWIGLPPKNIVICGTFLKGSVIEHEDGTITVEPRLTYNKIIGVSTVAIAAGKQSTQDVMDRVNKILTQKQLEEPPPMDLSPFFGATLAKLGQQFYTTTKVVTSADLEITINPKFADELEEAYTKNLNFYIKGWQQDAIERLRVKMVPSVCGG